MNEETWDDLAIIQAFERALEDQNSCTVNTQVGSEYERGCKVDNESRNNYDTGTSSAGVSFERVRMSGSQGEMSKQTHAEDLKQETPQDHLSSKTLPKKSENRNAQSFEKESSRANTSATHKGMDFTASMAHYPLDTSQEESLNSLLLSWYRLGYQTGRYQTIQELKAKSKTFDQ